MPRQIHFLARLLMLAALVTVGAGGTALAQTSEAELRAAFIFALSKYIEWPAERIREGAPLRVCSTVSNPIIVAFQGLSGKAVRGHPLEILIGTAGYSLNDCHILILTGEGQPVPQRPGLLTVIDRPTLGNQGSMVALGIENNRVVFEFNLAIARQQGLSPSAQVLKLARRVIDN